MRFPELEREVLERLSERPYTMIELTRATGRHKQNIWRKLKELVKRGYVERRGREYYITENGERRLSELHERRRNRLIYDSEISNPKLMDADPFFLSDLPPPCRYRARLYVDSSIEEEFRAGRAHYLWVEEGITDVKVLRRKMSSEELREGTIEEIAQKAVSEFALNTILTRLLYLIREKRRERAKISKEDLEEALKFKFTLTVDYENILTKESGEVLVALLGLWSINHYAVIKDVCTVDVLKVLTNLGYGPKRIAELAEMLHGRIKVIKSGIGYLQTHIRKPLKEDEALRLKKELFKLCMKILRKHGRISRKGYKRCMTFAEYFFKPAKIEEV